MYAFPSLCLRQNDIADHPFNMNVFIETVDYCLALLNILENINGDSKTRGTN